MTEHLGAFRSRIEEVKATSTNSRFRQASCLLRPSRNADECKSKKEKPSGDT